jgi:hypothetical protein
MQTRHMFNRRSGRSVSRHVPVVIGMLLLLFSVGGDSVNAQWCWGYCTSPDPGACYTLCEVEFSYWYSQYTSTCAWYQECLFGGGCGCECHWKAYWEYCTGFEV